MAHAQVIQKGTVIEFQLRDVRLNLEEATPVAGHFYLTDEVKATNIKLKTGLDLDNVQAKFNLKDDLMELYLEDFVLQLKGTSMAYFEQDEKRFIRGSEITAFDASENLFYYQLGDFNTYNLFLSETIEIKSANYNEALGVGEKADQYVKTKNYHLVKDEKVIIETTSCKKIFKFLISQHGSVKPYMKTHELQYDEPDLRRVLGFMESTIGHEPNLEN